MDMLWIAALLMSVLLFLLGTGLWVALSLFTVALVAMVVFTDAPAGTIMASTTWSASASWTLTALPLFIWMGEILYRTRLSQDMFTGLSPWLQRVPGRLLHSNVIGCGIFAAVSGSSAATAATIGRISLPELRQRGYEERMAIGSLAGAGTLGLLIPPSIIMIVYGVAAEVSIAKLFIAGIVPGIMIGLALALTWWWVGRKETLALPPRKTRAEVLAAARDAVWALMLPVFILVGLRMGVFTPTEAAVVAAVYALFVATVVYRELTLPSLVRIFITAARTTAVVMFLVAAAMVSAWLVTVANLPAQMVDLLRPLLDSPTLLLLAIMLLVMLVGTAMDMTPTILIMTPVLMPLVKAAGIDPVYFGVLFIINNSIGLITPPVGTVLNVVAGVGRMKIDEVTRGVLPFMAAQVAVMLIMVLFPQTVLAPLRWFY